MGVQFGITFAAQLMFTLTWINPAVGSLRRGRRRPAQTATSLFVVTSTMPKQSPSLFLGRPLRPENPAALTGDGFPKAIKGTLDFSTATIQYVRVDHRGLDVHLSRFARGRAVVKHEEAANPVDVGLFGTAAVVSGAPSTTQS